MYALRDATGTVESIPLIAASIMSKKLAEGLTGLVLDVKRGSGAFLPELERELELATTMIELGADHGCPVVALLTAMDRPLGRACGNALEVEESIAALRGEGPPDLMSVTYALGAEMLVLAGVAADHDAARRMMEIAIGTGRAAEHFQKIIEAQGGNPAVVDDPALLPQAAEVELFAATRRGFVARVEPRAVGRGVTALGGGRTTMEDKLDLSVGFVITARPGDWVEQGEPLATIFARDRAGVETGRAALRARHHDRRRGRPAAAARVASRDGSGRGAPGRGLTLRGRSRDAVGCTAPTDDPLNPSSTHAAKVRQARRHSARSPPAPGSPRSTCCSSTARGRPRRREWTARRASSPGSASPACSWRCSACTCCSGGGCWRCRAESGRRPDGYWARAVRGRAKTCAV